MGQAERKTSLGKDWHPQCLRCENCDKSLTPGKHSEHLDKPYCNTCYQTLYGPEGYRFGCVEPRKVRMEEDTQSASEKQEILSKIREYNLYKKSPQEKLKTREVNGVVLFEGVLKLYWGLKKAVTLPPGSTYAKQRYNRDSIYDLIGDEASYILLLEEAQKARSRRELFESERRRLKEIVENSIQLSGTGVEEQRTADLQDLSVSYSDNYNPMNPTNCDPMNYDPMNYDPLNSTHSLPASIRNRPPLESSQSVDENEEQGLGETFTGDTNSLPRSRKRQSTVYDRSRSGSVVMRKRSASFRKISRAKKLEESKDVMDVMRSQFTPPYGSSTNIRVGSTLKTRDVMQLLMNKFKVENDISGFALYIVYDNGAQALCREEDCPLLLRLKLGPSEEIAKLFVMEAVDAERTQLSAEAAEWIKFAIPELEIFCKKYKEEEDREVEKLRQRFLPWRRQLADQINEMRESNRVYHETDF